MNPFPSSATARQYVEYDVGRLKVGHVLHMHPQMLMQAYPSLWGGGGIQGAIDRFLSSQIGSAYGAVRAFADPMGRFVVISRHAEDPQASHADFVYHVDEDRQYLFYRVPGGWRRRRSERLSIQEHPRQIRQQGDGAD